MPYHLKHVLPFCSSSYVSCLKSGANLAPVLTKSICIRYHTIPILGLLSVTILPTTLYVLLSYSSPCTPENTVRIT